ncbi:hypothetical protein [Aliterella atlantica]|uniref:Uncharacterized protein n=1 Tax=Aliterella atlantica CENA595 TaxID=1618023 RepID=A0A0D8ZXK2_9CYAN|nr:hypothetical protein [Aliterella atlantica]KJH73127.1 hypothetical protein UH38_03460 [Aliterella atlantica CENA595]
MQSKDIETQNIVNPAESDSDLCTDENKNQLLTSDLGWTAAEIEETYHRLKSFKDDWDVPGMEAYDEI